MFAKWKKSKVNTKRKRVMTEEERQEEIAKSLEVKLAIYADKEKKKTEYAATANKKRKAKIAEFSGVPVDGIMVEELPSDSMRTAVKVKEAKTAWDEAISGRDKTVTSQQNNSMLQFEKKYG